ncbi:hypothetical protein LM597_00325 [Candidatus Acetothermia bacterium]|jgi:membrane protein implicated in regulation of membrane protease activity|nr:hypothetical protein [Candidatus Acetothermia bacterium]MCI2425866.1 hypothetical protein [Candidatus Acetothermia bacterium]MCI2427755.1 hypothetical protein [Candidatus Acetothermia bacterium]MCI2428467.1 hypothetical protein [Candidatus Acetothermia bacterium]
MKITKQRRAALVSAVLILAGSFFLLFVLPDIFREWFLRPLIDAILVLYVRILRLPQFFLWTVVVGLFSLIGVVNLIRFQRRIPRSLRQRRRRRGVEHSLIEKMAILISKSDHNHITCRRVTHRFVTVLAKLVAQRVGVSLQEATEMIHAGKINDHRIAALLHVADTNLPQARRFKLFGRFTSRSQPSFTERLSQALDALEEYERG